MNPKYANRVFPGSHYFFLQIPPTPNWGYWGDHPSLKKACDRW